MQLGFALEPHPSAVHRERVARILRMYEAASADQRSAAIDGPYAYRNLRRLCDRVRLEAGADSLFEAVAVFAALSPLLTFEENVRALEQAYFEGRFEIGLGSNRNKARRILEGASTLDVVRGPKVWSFVWSILFPDNGFSVCVDRHVGRVALGWSLSWRAVDDRLKRPGVYRKVADAYRDAARRVGLLPLELQAVAWVKTREGLEQDRLF